LKERGRLRKGGDCGGKENAVDVEVGGKKKKIESGDGMTETGENNKTTNEIMRVELVE
jgi:hypothetical protein